METLNLNNLLNREEEANKFKEILKKFELNKHKLDTKKGIYIYGEPGTGKSSFFILPRISIIFSCHKRPTIVRSVSFIIVK